MKIMRFSFLNIQGKPTKPTGNFLIWGIINSDKTCKIQISNQGESSFARSSDLTKATNGEGSDSNVFFDPNEKLSILTTNTNTQRVEGMAIPREIILGHELTHAYRAMTGTQVELNHYAYRTYIDSNGNKVGESWRVEEYETMGLLGYTSGVVTENLLRKENGYLLRGAYGK